MLDLINQHSLSQFTDKPTRTRGNNILDLVLSTIPDSVSKIHVVESISDHSVVISDLILKVKPTRKVKRKIYIYKKADSELLKDEISSAWDKFQTSQPHDRSVEQNWCHFKRIILTAIKNHFPTKTISGRWNVPWITQGWRGLMRKHKEFITSLNGRKIRKIGRNLKSYGKPGNVAYGGEYWTKMELNKYISNRVMHYIVPCGDTPSKTTNFSVDRYTIPDTSCYCIGHAPTSYRMLLYRAWCCQIVINVRR